MCCIAMDLFVLFQIEFVQKICVAIGMVTVVHVFPMGACHVAFKRTVRIVHVGWTFSTKHFFHWFAIDGLFIFDWQSWNTIVLSFHIGLLTETTRWNYFVVPAWLTNPILDSVPLRHHFEACGTAFFIAAVDDHFPFMFPSSKLHTHSIEFGHKHDLKFFQCIALTLRHQGRSLTITMYMFAETSTCEFQITVGEHLFLKPS